MDRSEIMEIRKLFGYKEGDSAFGHFAGCFINTDKEIKGRFSENFLLQEKNTILKFCDFYKKTLANNDADLHFDKHDKEDGGMQFLLEKIRGTGLKAESVNEILYEKFRDALPDNNFVVTMVHYSYDVPVKTTDKRKIDDASAEMFRFIVCSVCPVKTTKGTLGYLPDRDKIGPNAQQLVIDKPVFGFMYPSFNGRTSDVDNVLCFRTEDMDISEEFFAHKAPEIVKEEKVKKSTAKRSLTMETTAADGDITDSDSSERIVIGAPSKGISMYGSVNDIPSLDTGMLNNDAHYVPERLIDDSVEDTTPQSGGPSSADIISSSGFSHKKPSDRPSKKRPVTISGDRSRIKKRTIEGVTYYMIPVNEANVD